MSTEYAKWLENKLKNDSTYSEKLTKTLDDIKKANAKGTIPKDYKPLGEIKRSKSKTDR